MFDDKFVRRGCLTIPKLFDPAFIDRLREMFDRQFAAADVRELTQHLKVGDGRFHFPVRLDGPFLDPALYAHPILIRLIRNLLGSDAVIDSIACVAALPGAADQRLHRDHPNLFPDERRSRASIPPFAITVAIPLVDLTADTGTTKLHPETHHLDLDPEGALPPETEDEWPYIEQGGCFLMDYRLWHQGTANRSSAIRPVIYIVYARAWFTDIANFRNHARLLIDAEGAAAIPAEHRPLFARLAGKGALDMTMRDWLDRA